MKIMRVGYYWTSLSHDYHRYVRKCENCSFFSNKKIFTSLPLHPIQVDQPFTQWGLDFIGPINPPSSSGHKWILATTNYFIRWIDAISLKDATKSLVVEFLDGIVTKFDKTSTIILDNAKSFVQAQICAWEIDHNIYLRTSSKYYPQAMDQLSHPTKI